MISSVLGQVLLYSLRQLSSYLHVSALTLTLLTSEDRNDTGKFPVPVVAASLLEHTLFTWNWSKEMLSRGKASPSGVQTLIFWVEIK